MYSILIVDDEPLIRRGMKTFINFEKYKIDTIYEAENGESASRIFSEKLPDLVLLDINIPFKDGLSLAKEMKDLKKDVKIAIISGYDYFEYAQKAVKIGVEDYILKPVSNFVSTFKDVKSSFLFNLIKRFLAVRTAEFMVIMSIPFLKRLNIKMIVTAFAFFLVFSMKGMKLRWRVTVRTALLRVRHSSFTDNFRNFKSSAGDKFVEIKLGRDLLNRRLINSKRLVLRRN